MDDKNELSNIVCEWKGGVSAGMSLWMRGRAGRSGTTPMSRFHAGERVVHVVSGARDQYSSENS